MLTTRPLLRAGPLCGGVLTGPLLTTLRWLLAWPALRRTSGMRLRLSLRLGLSLWWRLSSWWSALRRRRWLFGSGPGR
ncbi:hypothetical protein GCM10027444_44280 [Actinopolyspora lacussalsi]